MKNRIISLLLLVLLSLTAISCSQDVIFKDISREVKLVNPEINGNIFSLVPLAGKLYVQNGNIWVKNDIVSQHGWSRIEKPEDSSSIIRLASDDAYLYAMDADFSVWAKPAASSSWTKVATDVTELFDNQVVATDCTTTGRTAYISAASTVKQLAGTGSPSTITVTDVTGNTGSVIRAAVSDGTTTFFSSNSVICASGTTLYYVDRTTCTIMYRNQGDTSWSSGGSVGNTPLSICPYGNSLLVGTTKGYEISYILSTNHRPYDGVRSDTNAESAFGRTRQVILIRYFGSHVYAGVVADTSSNYSKLWSLFGSSWNYE